MRVWARSLSSSLNIIPLCFCVLVQPTEESFETQGALRHRNIESMIKISCEDILKDFHKMAADREIVHWNKDKILDTVTIVAFD